MTHNEDVVSGGDEKQKLRGHYLRGWSGSLAYDLSLRGAQWDGTEGADRAGLAKTAVSCTSLLPACFGSGLRAATVGGSAAPTPS